MQDIRSNSRKKKNNLAHQAQRRLHRERVVFDVHRSKKAECLNGGRACSRTENVQTVVKIQENPDFRFFLRAYLSRWLRTLRRCRVLYLETKLFFTGRKGGMVVSMLFGAVFMGVFSYFFFGSRAVAEDASPIVIAVQQQVLGAETEGNEAMSDRVVFEQNIRSMVAGYPIEDMVPYIVKQDRRVAAYLVAIAKKESNWGRRIPVYYGENCFNYWGYRGQDEIMGSAGHTCFNTPKEAVTTVANRLNTLVLEQGLETAKELIVWKCGSSCVGHDSYDVAKWISDVDGYYREVFAMGE